MKVWVVSYTPGDFSAELFEDALRLLDEESVIGLRKFFRKEDSVRGLIGRLLPRMMLKEHGVAMKDLMFSKTQNKKPYILKPNLNPPLAYNITHDNGLVAMAYGQGLSHPPAFQVGIDIMKVQVPGRDTFKTFVGYMDDQLTPLERRTLSSVPEHEALERFFWIWTMKEAYTKALGLGLGFDFSRVEYDATADTIKVDAKIPTGWEFSKFTVNVVGDRYQGVVAEHVGGDGEAVIRSESEPCPWLISYDAVEFVRECIQSLS